MIVDYQRLGRAVAFYQERGYRLVDVPWIASREAVNLTRPVDTSRFDVADGILVGSAEQSFLHRVLHGGLPPGYLMAVTPCFRDEPEEKLDGLHFPYFMKLELWYSSPMSLFGAARFWDQASTTNAVEIMLRDARGFFASERIPVRVEEVDGHRDLVDAVHGIELGSYGDRKLLHAGRALAWAFGTGLAEPRASQVFGKLYPGA